MNKILCYDCCPITGEYIKPELICDGKEDCSTGRDEWFKRNGKICETEDFFKKMSMFVSSQNCLLEEFDCSHNDQCCSGYCKHGKCADERCIVNKT